MAPCPEVANLFYNFTTSSPRWKEIYPNKKTSVPQDAAE
jgi:hypothetical protein